MLENMKLRGKTRVIYCPPGDCGYARSRLSTPEIRTAAYPAATREPPGGHREEGGAHPSGEVSPRLDHLKRLERLTPDIPVGVLEKWLQRFGRAGNANLAENDGRPAPGPGIAGAGETDQGRCRRLADPPERLHRLVPCVFVAVPESLDERADGRRTDARERTAGVPSHLAVGVGKRLDERYNCLFRPDLAEHPGSPPADVRPFVPESGREGAGCRKADTGDNRCASPPEVLIIVAERPDAGGDRRLAEGGKRVGGERPDLLVRVAKEGGKPLDTAPVPVRLTPAIADRLTRGSLSPSASR